MRPLAKMQRLSEAHVKFRIDRSPNLNGRSVEEPDVKPINLSGRGTRPKGLRRKAMKVYSENLYLKDNAVYSLGNYKQAVSYFDKALDSNYRGIKW